MINRIYLLLAKELSHYFKSPLAYLLSAFFLVLMGWLFFSSVVMSGESQYVTLTQTALRPIFSNMNFLFLIIAPLITMRTFAEERKEGTLSALFLSNLTYFEMLMGKILGSFGVLFFMIILTFIFPLTLAMSGYSDWSIVLSGYVGTILNSLCYVVIGVFISTLTENQIVSALITFCLLLLMMMLPYAQSIVSNFLVAQMITYFSMVTHFEPFTRGAIRSDDIVYFLSTYFMFFYMSVKALESRKW